MLFSLKRQRIRYNSRIGQLCSKFKRHRLAEKYYRSNVELSPYSYAYEIMLGKNYFAQGKDDRAQKTFEGILKNCSLYFQSASTVSLIAQSSYQLASISFRNLRFQDAIDQLDRISDYPAGQLYSLVKSLSARSYLQLGNTEKARQLFEELLSLDHKTLNIVGSHYLGLLAKDDLEVDIEEVLDQKFSMLMEGQSGLAVADFYINQQRFNEAESILKKNKYGAFDLNSRLGEIYFSKSRFEDSRKAHLKAWSVRPKKLRNLAQAFVSYLNEEKSNSRGLIFKVVSNAPFLDLDKVLHRKIVMMGTDIEKVFDTYEGTEAVTALSSTFKGRYLDRFDVTKLTNKSVLVVPLWGIGDEIMLVGLYRDLVFSASKNNINLTIGVEPRLFTLFQRSIPEARFASIDRRHRGAFVNKVSAVEIENHDDLPDMRLHYAFDYPMWGRMNEFDYIVPAPFLVRTFLSSVESISEKILSAEETSLEKYKNILSGISSKPKIGISWRSGYSGYSQHNRSQYYTSLDQWAAIFELQDRADFVNLQYDNSSSELEQISKEFGVDVINFENIDMFNDFEQLSALIQSLDMTIAPCTSTGDLAGALGVPTLYTILAPEGNWRYQPHSNNDIWFKKIEFVSPDQYGDNSSLFSNLANKVGEYLTLIEKSKDSRL